MTGHSSHPNYLAVWIWLVVLAVASVLASQVSLPESFGATIVYGTALAKAILVGLYFMHLRTERPLVLSLVMIPLALFFILTVALLPDFVL